MGKQELESAVGSKIYYLFEIFIDHRVLGPGLRVEVDSDNNINIEEPRSSNDIFYEVKYQHSFGKELYFQSGTFKASRAFMLSCLMARDDVAGLPSNLTKYNRDFNLCEMRNDLQNLSSKKKFDDRRMELVRMIRELEFEDLCDRDPDVALGWEIACHIASGPPKESE
jgi:hypothetical protein